MTLHIHTQGGFNNHTTHILYRIVPGYGTSVQGVINLGNIVPRDGIELTSLAFQATITPHRLPNVTIMVTPTCLRSSLPQMSMKTAKICSFNICQLIQHLI